jgi:1,2-diacylglycerol 3-alpha-glucosyltransferase
MRILYVSDVYFPRVNGVSTSIRTFRNDLAAIGVDTILVAPEYPSASGTAVDGNVLRVPAAAVPLDPEDRRMHWRRLLDTLRAAHARGGFDAVHIQTPFLAHYAGQRIARECGLPALATYHTYFEDYLHHYLPILPRTAGRSLARAFTRSQCRALDLLISPSEPLRQALVNYGVTTPIEVIPTGMPAESFVPGVGERFRQRFQIPPRAKLLTYVGRVAHEKNIDFLLRMFVHVCAKRSDAVLLIAGEGPALPSLRARAAELGVAERVRFVGYLERLPGLADCYAAADVFVFASRTETQGLVLLEAMAQGTAVVSIAELGTRTILTPESGAIVVPEDEAAFAYEVIRVLAAESLRSARAEQLRAHALKWSSREFARRVAATYQRVIDQHAAQKNAAPVGAARS